MHIIESGSRPPDLRMGKRKNTPDFDRSNRIHAIKFRPTAEERSLTRKIIKSSRSGVREAYGQKLLNGLCERFRVPQVRLQVIDAHQPHKKQSGRLAYKEYGAYYLQEQVIRIANLTAVRGKVVAGKTFFDTLLHEFMHHLDRKYLRISSTPHSKGFYNRVDNLKQELTGSGSANEVGSPLGQWEPPPKGLLAALERAVMAAKKNNSTGRIPPEKRRPAPGLFSARSSPQQEMAGSDVFPSLPVAEGKKTSPSLNGNQENPDIRSVTPSPTAGVSPDTREKRPPENGKGSVQPDSEKLGGSLLPRQLTLDLK